MKIETNGLARDLSTEIPMTNIVILKGPNGGGKSTIVDALRAALGDPKARMVRHEGLTGKEPATMTIEFGEHKLVATCRDGSKLTTKGAVPIGLLQAPADALANLIGPDERASSDPAHAATAAKMTTARVQALAELCNVKIDDAVIKYLAADCDLSKQIDRSSLFSAVEAIKADLEASARVKEDDAKQLKGAVDMLHSQALKLQDVEGLPSVSAEDVAAAKRAEQDAYKAFVSGEASAKARAQMETQQEEARGKIVEPTWMQVRANMDIIKTAIDAYDPVDADWTYLDRAINALFGSIGNAKREAEQHAKLTAILSQPITGATDAEVATLRQGAESTASNAFELSERRSAQVSAADLRKQLADAEAKLERATAAAKAYREASSRSAIWGRAGQLLAKAGLSTIAIKDGDIQARGFDGIMRPYGSLSVSERVVAAVLTLCDTVTLDSAKEFTFLFLPERVFSALQADARHKLDASLEENFSGMLKILTEEGAEGPLRMEGME